MAKTSRTQHSRPKRDPVTIDLDPASVERAETPESGEQQTAGTDKSGVGESGAAAAGAQAGSTRGGAKKTSATREQSAKGGADTSVPGGSATGNGGAGGTGTGSQARGGGGRTSSLLAGVAGGLIALVLAAGLQWTGLLPAPDTGGETNRFEMLDRTVASLRQDVEALGETDEAPDEELAEATSRIEAVEAGLASVREDVSELADSAASGGEGAGDAGELSARIDELEDRVGEFADAGAASGEGADFASLGEGLRAAEEAASDNAGRIAALEEELASLGERMPDADAGSASARLVAAMALKSTVDRGAPFASELEAYLSLAPEPEGVAALSEHAADGVPTAAAIAAQAPDAASRMVAAAHPQDEEDGFFERLLASARSLVVVRPVGSVEGEDASAIAARMEAAALEGDYETALAEYDAMPDAARQEGGEFADMLRARLAADRTLEQALSDALDAV